MKPLPRALVLALSLFILTVAPGCRVLQDIREAVNGKSALPRKDDIILTDAEREALAGEAEWRNNSVAQDYRDFQKEAYERARAREAGK